MHDKQHTIFSAQYKMKCNTLKEKNVKRPISGLRNGVCLMRLARKNRHFWGLEESRTGRVGSGQAAEKFWARGIGR